MGKDKAPLGTMVKPKAGHRPIPATKLKDLNYRVFLTAAKFSTHQSSKKNVHKLIVHFSTFLQKDGICFSINKETRQARFHIHWKAHSNLKNKNSTVLSSIIQQACPIILSARLMDPSVDETRDICTINN